MTFFRKDQHYQEECAAINSAINKIPSKVHITSVPVIFDIHYTRIQEVSHYVYLRKIVQLNKLNFGKDIPRRILLGFAVFGKVSDVFSSNVTQRINYPSTKACSTSVGCQQQHMALKVWNIFIYIKFILLYPLLSYV